MRAVRTLKEQLRRGCQERKQLACETDGLQVALQAAVQASQARRGMAVKSSHVKIGPVQFDLHGGDLDEAEAEFFPGNVASICSGQAGVQISNA